ncbi:MAG: C-GCAxxG-C-C family protein [Candidatus Margulisbacteria bacterium]|nr:C-GCAxxG-C-C family protein [Candidatus Margulisiibacteriota bacterium]
MPIEKAKKHYLGKDGHERLDCAQSILKAFAELDNADKESLCKGGGRAPGGECGAYCAAKHLLAKKNPDKLREFEDYFRQLAGSLKCNEIRQLRKLSCLGCVGKAAEYLHSSS